MFIHTDAHIRSAKPGFVVSVERLCGFKCRWERFRGLWCPCVEWSNIAVFFFNVLYRLAWTMRCCVAVYGVSGCNPASHKICKNNAITMTVYKVPAVNILVKVKKKYHPMYFFFLFPVCYIFKYSRWFLRQRNLTYLKSGTSQCSIV